jgi:hypothetical protein
MAKSQSPKDIIFEPLHIKAADVIVPDSDDLNPLEQSRKR